MNRNSTIIAAALALSVSLAFAGCDRNSGTASNSNPGPAQRTGAAIDNTARNAADNTRDAVNNTADNTRDAANNTINSAANNNDKSSIPGMPSVNGTSTSNLSTADAAAQRLIDNARNNISQGDTGKAKTLLAELQQKGMYDKLSADLKAKVDQLAKDLGATPTAENR